jgi:hypothetical protein
VDGQSVGQTQSSDKLVHELAARPVHVGVSSHDAWVEVAGIRVEPSGEGSATGIHAHSIESEG